MPSRRASREDLDLVPALVSEMGTKSRIQASELEPGLSEEAVEQLPHRIAK
jgi:hypothetical protein